MNNQLTGTAELNVTPTRRVTDEQRAAAWRESSRRLGGSANVSSPNVIGANVTSRRGAREESPTLLDVWGKLCEVNTKLTGLTEALQRLEARLDGPAGAGAAAPRAVPLELAAKVRHIHRTLGDQLQWEVGPQDTFRTAHNEEVTKAITMAIRDAGDVWGPNSLIRRACNRFYENLKQQHRAELSGMAEQNKKKKALASRRDRLFKRRVAIAQQGLLEEEDLEYLRGAEPIFMSDEESGEEDRRVLVVRRPVWRATRLTRVLKRCQDAIDEGRRQGQTPPSHKARVEGPPSTRQSPFAPGKQAYLREDE